LIVLDGEGNISMHSKVSITISCGEGESAASAISLDKDGNISMKAKNITALGSELISMGSGTAKGDNFNGSGFSLDPKNVSIGAKDKLSLSGEKSVEAGSEGGTIKLKSTGDTIIAGKNVNIN
jgi:hypothetical protein